MYLKNKKLKTITKKQCTRTKQNNKTNKNNKNKNNLVKKIERA